MYKQFPNAFLAPAPDQYGASVRWRKRDGSSIPAAPDMDNFPQPDRLTCHVYSRGSAYSPVHLTYPTGGMLHVQYALA